MADRIYPSEIIQGNTPLGIDQNQDWQAFYVDKQADGDHALRVSTLVDRTSSKIVNRYSASLANHSATVRYTYTVPNGKRALFEYVHFHIAQPASGKIRACYIRVNEVYLISFIVENGNTLWTSRTFDMSLNIWLKATDYVDVITYSDDTVSGSFEACTCFTEFDG